MSSTERSLVLGAYTRLPAYLAEPFATSLRSTGFRGKFVAFSGKLDAGEQARLRELADEVVQVDADYPAPNALAERLLWFLRTTRGLRRTYATAFEAVASLPHLDRSRWWRRLEYHLEGLQSLRSLHYLDYLRSAGADADVVMLTDVRDVYFQRDPFADPVRGLELYLEDDSVRIGHDLFNTRWIRNLYGSREVERLRGRPVSCSGTVVGTRELVVEYLEHMRAEVVRWRRPMAAHDQGVHNALLHSGRLPFATTVPNGTGRVLTLGKQRTYAIDAGVVFNDDGSVPAVLHQWDRQAELAAMLRGVDGNGLAE